MAVALDIDREAWRKRNERFEILKKNQFPGNGKIEKMYPELYKSAMRGNVNTFIDLLEKVSEEKKLSLSSIFEQVTPSGNSLLHLVASCGNKDITQLVVDHFPHLITKENLEGDTALHLSARAGKLNTTETLIQYAKNNTGQHPVADLLGLKNKKGHTALHDAVIGRHYGVVDKLVLADPNEKDYQSPLYLAVKMNSERIFFRLFDAIKDSTDIFSSLEGRSLLLAAIEQKNLAILGMIAEKMLQLIHVSNEESGSLLHFASSIGFADGVRRLLETFSDCAFERNQDGLHAVHVACQKGYVGVLTEFTEKWPYPTEFLTTKGQNILHVAADSGQHNVVKFILRHHTNDSNVLNKQDDDGNTPLHLAAKQGHSLVVFALVRDKRVNKLVANNENLTSYQIAQKQSKIALAEYEKSDRKDQQSDFKPGDTVDSTNSHGKNQQSDSKPGNTTDSTNSHEKQSESKPQNTAESTNSHGKNNPGNPKKQPTMAGSNGLKQLENYYGVTMTLSILFFTARPKMPPAEHFGIQGTPPLKKEIKSRMENLLVVAVLVAGVTFAGAIQLPQLAGNRSGENSISENSNCETNNGGALLDVYIYLDMWAFSTSVVAAIIICWTQLNIINFAPSAVWIASRMIGSSIYTMCMAFLFAVIIALRNEYGFLTIIIAVLGAVFLFAQTILCLQWFLPPIVNQIFEGIISHCIYFLAFLVYFCYKWLLGKIISDRK